MFDVVGTQFHEGRLDVVFNPQVGAAQLTTYDVALQQYFASFVIRNGQSSFKVRVPFLSDTAWKRVSQGVGFTSQIDQNETFTGLLSLFVSVPLKAPTTVTPSVSINVFIGAEEDFEFNVPNLDGNAYRYVPYFSYNSLPVTRSGEVNVTQVQSGLSVDEPAVEMPEATLGVNTKVQKNDVFHFGERYETLRELCKRYIAMDNIPYIVTSADVASPDPIIILVDPFVTAKIANSFTNPLIMPFRLMRGSYCVKIRVRSEVSTSEVYGWVTFYANPNSAPATSITNQKFSVLPNLSSSDSLRVNFQRRPIPRAFFTTEQTAEFVVPYTSIYDAQINPLSSLGTYPTLSSSISLATISQRRATWRPYFVVAVSGNFTANQRIVVDVDISFGDEMHAGVFIGVPGMAMKGTGFRWPDFNT